MRALVHMVALVAALAPSAVARADGKRLYNEKCLYCHSGTLTERLRLRPSQWKRVVARMRRHSPLLFSESEAAQIVRYLVRERHLVPKEPLLARAPRRAPAPAATPTTAAEAEEPDRDDVEAAEAEATAPGASAPAPVPPEPVIESTDPEAEEKGPGLVAEKCSKCHTTRRVYMKVETVENGDAIIERMRHKTGSGISPEDADLLHRFLRARVATKAD